MLLGFGCIFPLGDLVDLNLGLLPFDVNWLFHPFVDVNSSLCWCSLLFGMAGTGCSFPYVVALSGALVKQAWW